VSKRSVSSEFVTVLARLLTRHGNPVGALMYGDRMDAVIPPGRGRRHVLHLLHRLLTRPESPASRVTDLAAFLRAALPVLKRRALVFVVSDFISSPGWAEPLALLARRHEVVAVRLFDPLEIELPDLGLVVLQDAETGEQAWVDTHDRGFRGRFASVVLRHESELRRALAQAGVDCLELSTEGRLVEAVLRFAELRKRRGLLAGGGLPAHLEGAA
jgi:uncharacterized protein (DUF58 family)